MHLSFATGFMITEGGIMVTNYHVANNKTALALGAMGIDGKLYPVKEVLAASEEQDIALLQLDGTGFAPLPLNPLAEIGSAVSIIGHPERNCYVLSTGIISQYPIMPQKNGKTAQMMCVTAEYGVGSSGGPALNERGEVVGMVSSTHTVVADPHSNMTTQMVMRYCTPSAAILNLIKPPAKK
jgi:S1-C subfamily serine protease